MPLGYEAVGDAAIEILETRECSPRIRIDRGKDGRWNFANPYDDEHDERWFALLANAFGTRSMGAINHFLQTLTNLVPPGAYDHDRGIWFPCEDDYQAALNIISSLKPQNEAQAAYAAQLVALHLSSVKLGQQMSKSWADPRTAAILAKTVRAYGDGLERVARLQGKAQSKQINQTIQVVYVDRRNERKIVVDGGGSGNGGQPHTIAAQQGRRAPAASVPELPALPSSCTQYGETMQVSGGKGKACLPNARWWERIWCSLRRA